jgi:hypothetical protein
VKDAQGEEESESGRKCWEGLGENASTGREEIREGEEQKTTKEENRKISRNGSGLKEEQTEREIERTNV